MNMSTPGEQVQILEERVKELKDRLGTCDDALRVSLERDLRISDEKNKILQNKIRQLDKYIKELEDELAQLT
jgi:predicted RNase H-like nuclease (RuvC/YqgF family)